MLEGVNSRRSMPVSVHDRYRGPITMALQPSTRRGFVRLLETKVSHRVPLKLRSPTKPTRLRAEGRRNTSRASDSRHTRVMHREIATAMITLPASIRTPVHLSAADPNRATAEAKRRPATRATVGQSRGPDRQLKASIRCSASTKFPSPLRPRPQRASERMRPLAAVIRAANPSAA